MKAALHLILVLGILATGLSVSATQAQGDPATIVVMTPWLAQPGTQLMVDAFKAAATEKGWNVNVVDTAGDRVFLFSEEERLNDESDGQRGIGSKPTYGTGNLEKGMQMQQ